MCEWCNGQPGERGCEMCGEGRAEAIAVLDAQYEAKRKFGGLYETMTWAECQNEAEKLSAEMHEVNAVVLEALVFGTPLMRTSARSRRSVLESKFDACCARMEELKGGR